MATPNEKLASSLAVLHALQKDGRRVLHSKELSRVHRERLLKQDFLREVIKGWLISSAPGAAVGDSTPWFASFWEFCARYCNDRFDGAWHLSPEQSILLHAENTVIPEQVIIYSPKGTNNTLKLPFGTSIYDLKQQNMSPAADLGRRDDLHLFSTPAALVRVPATFFARYPIETRVALGGIKDVSNILGRLLDGGHSVVAGRIAGAFRRIGRTEIADDIMSAMKAAGYAVHETDPYAPEQTFAHLQASVPPIVGRLQAAWESMRKPVIDALPKAPGLPKNQRAYLGFVDDIYKSDAYHSLSIEGYSVTPELIDHVRSGSWSPEASQTDRESRDALAARGYWQAFQLVKYAVAAIIGGKDSASLVRSAYRAWYRELFEPCVIAGLIPPAALAGFRNHFVFLRGSRYVPPRADVVSDAMSALFDMIAREEEASVRAVLGHWMLGYIHPYPDGNGRMARFLMNAILASGGYPWTVIRVEDRTEYLHALDRASIDLDVLPFAKYVAKRVRWSMRKWNKK